MESIHYILLIGIVSIALITDLKYRKVPNLLIVIGLILGLIYQSLYGSLADGVMGLLVASISFLFFLFGEGLGAGDVKLLMVIGLFTNPSFAYITLVYTAIFGGIFVLFVLIYKRRLKTTYQNIQFTFFYYKFFASFPIFSEEDSITVPYVVPIFLGTLTAIYMATSFSIELAL